MCNEKKNHFEMEKALEFRNYEIDNFWKRGWFFGALVLFLLTANFKIHELYKGIALQPYSVIVSFLATVTASVQAFMNRGSKYWQERWEYIAKNREMGNESSITTTEADDYYMISACILDKEEPFFARAKRISVSKLTFIVWDILAFTCIMNWINEIFLFLGKPFPPFIAVIMYHIGAIIYIITFVIFGKIGSPLDIEKKKTRKQKKSERKDKIKQLKDSYVGKDKV